MESRIWSVGATTGEAGGPTPTLGRTRPKEGRRVPFRTPSMAMLELMPGGLLGTQAGPLDGHVVIIDDDASLRRSLSNLLGSVGFNVETFVSAEAFLASDHQEQARCLVVDLRMPGMTGLDLLRHLAAIGSSVPAIVLTAHDNDEARRECLEAGAFAFLEKPFRSPTLLDAVRRALVARRQDPP